MRTSCSDRRCRHQIVSNSTTGRFAVYRPAMSSLEQSIVLFSPTTRENQDPIMIPELQTLPIISISFGDSHSFALTIDGRVFSWGFNYQGALGLGERNIRFSGRPMEVPFFGHNGQYCVSINAHGWHSCALAIDLRVRIAIRLTEFC